MENNNNPIVLVVFVVLVVAIVGYIIYAKIKRRNASWTGTVIDKNMTETARAPMNNGNTNSGITFGGSTAVDRNYTIRVKGDAGKEFTWPVGEGFYNSTNVGDRLQKSPGTETPTKI